MPRRNAVPKRFVVLLAFGASCATSGRPLVTARATGTCEEACARYQECKGEARPECLPECREIFVDEGTPDRATLKDYQAMNCDEVVSFVEGTGPTARHP